MSYTLAYKGAEIDDILGRAAPGGAIDTAIATKQDALTFDAVPTEGSTNPAESGGIYDAIQAGGAAALAAFATDSVSGDVVSFPDGAGGIPVKSFTGSILPQQNLNGQSAPYPAGGGKNKFNKDDAGKVSNAFINAATGGYGGSGEYYATDYIPVNPSINTNMVVSGYTKGYSSGSVGMACYNSEKTYIRGSNTSVIDITGASYVRLSIGLTDENTFMLEYGSTATTPYVPYSNICPISGWTGANIARTGKNLFGGEPLGDAIYAHATGSIDKTAKTVTFTHGDGSKLGFNVKWQPNTQYTFLFTIASYSAQNTSMRVWYTDGTKTSISFNNLSAGSIVRYVTAANKTVDGVYLEWFATGSVGVYYEKSGVFEGSVNTTDLEPYTADTILLSFGQTVYAGTLTALGGGLWKVQPTHGVIDLGTLSWTYGSVGVNGFMYTSGLASAIVKPSTTSEVVPMVADHFKVVSADGVASQSGALIGVVTNGNVRAKYDGFSSATFASDVSGWMLVYPLATLPDPITITGEDLQTLLGSNTVWTDVGSVTGMTYRADTALYIQKLIGGGGTLSTLSMASPSPSLSLGRVGVLAEPEEAEPEQTDEEAEQLEQTEEPEQAEEE